MRMSHVIVTGITVEQGGDKGDLACEAVPDIGGVGSGQWAQKTFRTLKPLVYCMGRGIPIGFGWVLHPGMGMGLDSCTCELQNKPWIIQNG